MKCENLQLSMDLIIFLKKVSRGKNQLSVDSIRTARLGAEKEKEIDGSREFLMNLELLIFQK